jgi:hypothetical protein
MGPSAASLRSEFPVAKRGDLLAPLPHDFNAGTKQKIHIAPAGLEPVTNGLKDRYPDL